MPRPNLLGLSLATLTILVAACGGGDEGRPDGTQPQPPLETPLASPTVALEPDTLAQVITTELYVRSQPRLADDSQMYQPALGAGQQLFVVDGPHVESGYVWYLVQPVTPEGTEQLPFGWVASADRDGEAWLEAVEPECPSDEPSIEEITRLAPEEQLVCFGDRDLTFSGRQQSCGVSSSFIEPSWFAGSGCGYGTDFETQIFPRFPPEVGGPSGPGPQEFTGHFDDPRAQNCRLGRGAPSEDPAPPPPEQLILWCRLQFVVVSAEPAS